MWKNQIDLTKKCNAINSPKTSCPIAFMWPLNGFVFWDFFSGFGTMISSIMIAKIEKKTQRLLTHLSTKLVDRI